MKEVNTLSAKIKASCERDEGGRVRDKRERLRKISEDVFLLFFVGVAGVHVFCSVLAIPDAQKKRQRLCKYICNLK